MEAEGLNSLFPMRELSVMGILEIAPRLPRILRRIAQTIAYIEAEKPDLIVTIDSPDFCFRVAKALHKRGNIKSKMVHYVAPTVWAWRPERAQKVAELYDGIMCLFPFEPPFFTDAGMSAAYIGHPLLEAGLDQGDPQVMRNALGITAQDEVMGLFFGSRLGEINKIGPVLRDVACLYAGQRKSLHIMAPTFKHLRPQIENLLQDMPCNVHVIDDQTRKPDCFAAMDKAMATSGTVGLELCLAGIPHLIAYKTNFITAEIVRRKIRVSYAHLGNILLERGLVPEFIQENCKTDLILKSFLDLDCESQRKGFSEIRKRLISQNAHEPSRQAAEYLMAFMRCA
jgi:lipid-A-disaccharide synthase